MCTVLKIVQFFWMAFAAGLWNIGIINRAFRICSVLESVCFFFCSLFDISSVACFTCNSFYSMKRFLPLLVIGGSKLSDPVFMTFKGTCGISFKMLDPYLVEPLLLFDKRSLRFMTIDT